MAPNSIYTEIGDAKSFVLITGISTSLDLFPDSFVSQISPEGQLRRSKIEVRIVPSISLFYEII